MKKIVAFASTVALGLSLVACGEAAEDTGEEMAAEAESMADDDAVVMSDAEAEAMVDEAAEDAEEAGEETAEEADAM